MSGDRGAPRPGQSGHGRPANGEAIMDPELKAYLDRSSAR